MTGSSLRLSEAIFNQFPKVYWHPYWLKVFNVALKIHWDTFWKMLVFNDGATLYKIRKKMNFCFSFSFQSLFLGEWQRKGHLLIKKSEVVPPFIANNSPPLSLLPHLIWSKTPPLTIYTSSAIDEFKYWNFNLKIMCKCCISSSFPLGQFSNFKIWELLYLIQEINYWILEVVYGDERESVEYRKLIS